MTKPLYKIPPRSVDTPFGVYDNLPPSTRAILWERAMPVLSAFWKTTFGLAGTR